MPHLITYDRLAEAPAGETARVPADRDRPHVSSSRDNRAESRSGRKGRLRDADRRHRAEFARYAREESDEGYRGVLAHIYAKWEGWNRDHFGGLLDPPHFLLAEPRNPRALGDHSLLSAWGSTAQTRIRPSIVKGTHPAVRGGDAFLAGRLLLAADTAFHETVHQYNVEILGCPEDAYRGHGPVFRDQCNRIGATLGLSPVRTGKTRGRDRDLPSCAEWPICVRSKGYYLGAYLPHEEADLAGDREEKGEPEPPKALADWIADNPEWADRFRRFGEAIFGLIDRFFDEYPAPTVVQEQAVTFLAKCYRHRRRTAKPKPSALPALMPPHLL